MDFCRNKIFTECTEKEQLARLKWFEKNQTVLEERYKQRKKSLVTSEDYKMLNENLKYFTSREAKVPNVKLKNNVNGDFKKILNTMYPVDDNERNILSKQGYKSYLNERYKKSPDLRYYNPETTSFKYGWKILEYQSDENGRLNDRFGRSGVIKRNFYRPFGCWTLQNGNNDEMPKSLS